MSARPNTSGRSSVPRSDRSALRDDPRLIVVDAQRRRRRHADVEADVRRRGGRPGPRPPAAPASPPAKPLNRPPEVSNAARPAGALDRHVAGHDRRRRRSLQREAGVDQRAHAFRIAQAHVLAGGGDVELAQLILRQADAAAEADRPAAKLRGDAVEAHARRVERDDAVDVFERVRERQLAEAAVRTASALPATTGSRRPCPTMRAVTSARPELRTSGEEALQHREVGRAVRLQRQRLIARDSPSPLRSSSVSSPTSRSASTCSDLPFDAQPNRRGIAQPIVEQRDVDLLDRRIDAQRVRVVELADHADGAAGNRRRERRERRLNGAHVRDRARCR